ncbi:hermansky-Pudlak syndrome 4 protein [Plakobranchus ocellatus]|uniref:Hermansky-Pudlak syndrome 4 protein n=1 Tax=Plakobranchus ocellatus TaxID=259542 RepID=A0AAV4DAG7_9GAST|nr:hermansky-Pudlak syndrome 4 protein [Plakobranchus ocellatus]
MAASHLHSSFRHEGHIFFIYDHRIKSEEDDPSEAILYFYPASVTTEQQIAIVGGIIGITDFCLEFLPQSMPSIVKLNGHNFALLQHEEFVIGLAGSVDIPDNFLISHMQFVWSTFILYQGSLGAIRERVSDDNFVKELNRIWDMYLPLCQIHSDPLSQAFKVLPYVQLHKSQGSLYLHASHILQRTLRFKGVVAGALFSWKKVLCSQLSNSLTRQLLLLMTQSQFPCVEANSIMELPGGVRLLHVFLPEEEYEKLSHRRRKAYNSPSHPLSAAGISWAGQPIALSQQSGGKGTYYTTFTIPLGGSNGKRSAISYRESCQGNEVYSTASENNMQGNRGKSSDSQRNSGLSPTAGRPISGTDSEVFMDTLADNNFGSTKEDEKNRHMDHTVVEKLSFNYDRSRNYHSYALPSNFTSSSEQNSPDQKPFLVFAEVHANSTNKPVEAESQKLLGQKRDDQKDTSTNKLAQSDEVLVFGQDSVSSKELKGTFKSSGSIHENYFQSDLDGHTFSSISNLKSSSEQDGHSGSSLKPKVLETVVDFIYPSSKQKKAQIVSKTGFLNGILPSSQTARMVEDLEKWDSSDNKKSDVAEDSHTSEESRNEDHSSVETQHFSFNYHLISNTVANVQKNLSLSFVTQTTTASQFTISGASTDKTIAQSGIGLKDSVSTKIAQNMAVTLKQEASEVEQSSGICDQLDVDTQHRPSILTEENMTLSCSQSQQHQNYPKIQKSSHSEKDEASTSVEQSEDNQPQIKESTAGTEGEISSFSDISKCGYPQVEKDSNVQQAVAQSKKEIDASLEVRLSGDESSAHSSSEQFKLIMNSSNLSLTAGDLCPSKMRLTFEGQESDNSDTGIMSPLSVGQTRGSNGRLSPVEEANKDSDDRKDLVEAVEDYAVRRFSSDSERFAHDGSQHREDRKSTDKNKSIHDSQSPSCNVAEAQASNSGEEPVVSAQAQARWSPGKGKLHKMTLYAQGHSDTLLLLLLSKSASCSKSYINSLWKTCLSHLAELDFEVKDAERHLKDDSENMGAAYQYMRYDSFSQSLKGSALLPVSSLANEIVDTCVKMHDTFESMPDVQDITYRSHSACCYGHRAINTETYFQLGQPRNAAGICAQNDRTFSLEQLAGRILQNDVKLSIL